MNAEAKKIRILAVDDHALLRAGITSLVEIDRMELVAQARQGARRSQHSGGRPGHCRGSTMPDISGVGNVAIRSEFHGARMIVLWTTPAMSGGARPQSGRARPLLKECAYRSAATIRLKCASEADFARVAADLACATEDQLTVRELES
jgi:hypothetical protein